MRRSQTFIATAIISGFVIAAATPQRATAQQDGSLEEIVVTAQKRSEALAEVPMSVTVLSGAALERQNVENFLDMVALVPGFSLETSRPGVSRITLRGINTGGVASTVGVYVNDVPFGSSSGLANAAVLSGDFDTFDLARVEILRGPQGTLYGASSLGGVMKYVTNPASTEAFEARGRLSLETVSEGDLGYEFTGLVNVPVSDRVAIRASGFYRFDDGYVDSIGNNPIPALSDPSIDIIEGTLVEEDINEADTFGGRVSALFELSENATLDVTAMTQNIETGSSNIVDADPATAEPVNEFVRSRYHRDFTDIEYRVLSGTLDWDFGGAALQSITSYSTFEQDFRSDLAANTSLAGVPLAQIATAFFGDPLARPLSVMQDQVTSTDKFTQEFRLISADDDLFEWLVGLYFTQEDSGIDPQDIYAVEAGTDERADDIPLLARAKLVSDYEEIALFANATWHVTDRFELSFGARASENDQTASQVLEGALFGGAPPQFEDATSSESPFTYSFSPRFEINENLSVYGRIATGYRPGGPNVIPVGAPPGTPGSYESDSLTNYEVGLKADSPDGRFAMDVAAYFLDWEDVQLLAVVNGVGLNANGGTAESRGFEFAASFRPVDNVTLAFNGAYTDAELTQDTDPIVGGTDGDPLSFVPEWSFGLDGNYDWTLAGGAMAYVGGNLGYTGDRPAGFGNRAPDGSIREAEAYTTVNLRAGVEFERFTVEVYGKNVTDEEGVTDINDAGALPNGLIGVGYIRPRTIGVSVGARF